MLENDYFLAALKDDFVENARLFIFETYCRIHQCIDMRMLAGDTLLTNKGHICAFLSASLSKIILSGSWHISALQTIHANYFVHLMSALRDITVVAC